MPRGISRPPYAPAEALVRFLRRIPETRVPEAITPDYLAAQDLGAGAGNERHLVSALRFLGLVAEAGRPTAAFRALTVPARQREVLGQAVQAAYQPIFAAGPVPGLTRDEAERRFTDSYGVSGQIREKAIRSFAALCDLAGLPLAPDFLQRRQARLPGRRPRAAGASPRSRSLGNASAGRVFAWPFAVAVPANLSEDEMVLYLGKVTRALRRLPAEDLGGDLSG